jgi:Uma2 family endonuclease
MDDVLASVEVRRRRFRVEEYYRMAETGILTARDRVELIDGEIIEMTPIGHRHAACVLALSALLTRVLGDRALLSSQSPVLMPRDTEPQPDVVLLRPPLAQYWVRLPQPADLLLLVEVADTSYRFDREIKVPLYAAAGVPEVWLVDLTRNVVEVFRRPEGAVYRATERIARGGRLTPAAFPDVDVAVDDILPPA